VVLGWHKSQYVEILVPRDDGLVEGFTHDQQDISEVKSPRAARPNSARFGETVLIADAGLVPVVQMVERAWLRELVKVAVRNRGSGSSGGANVTSLIAEMRAGADSIDDIEAAARGDARGLPRDLALTSVFHARKTIATLRTDLVHIPARIAPSASAQFCTCRGTGPGNTVDAAVHHCHAPPEAL
jgi:hypothetical protein